MSRIRVHELAAEMGIDPRLIIEEGRKHGIGLSDAASELNTSDVFILRAFLRDAPRIERPPPPEPPRAATPEPPPPPAPGNVIPTGDGAIATVLVPEAAAPAPAAEPPMTPPHLAPPTPTETESEEAPPAEPVVAPHLVGIVEQPETLQPHVIGAALETGQVLWARVSGAQCLLRSGGQLHLTTRPPDGIEGWRPVRIVNSEKLLATALPVPGVSLVELDADDPETLWDMPEPGTPLPDRPESYPVGLAGSLMKKSAAYGIIALAAIVALAVGYFIGSAG